MKKIKTKYLLYLIILCYIFTFIISKTGYYEYHLKKRTTLTNEQIKKFENDVQNNVNVDINDYVVPENYDYTSKIGNITYKTTEALNNGMKKTIIWMFKNVSKLAS